MKKTLSLTLTQQLLIANTMVGSQIMPDSSHNIAFMLKKGSLYSLEVEAEARYTQNGYNFLLTIPPASIEPERAFSLVACFVLN